VWDHIPIEVLIEHATAGNYGLARAGWSKTLTEIRALPERVEPLTEETK
jgi:hypothetical protein